MNCSGMETCELKYDWHFIQEEGRGLLQGIRFLFTMVTVLTDFGRGNVSGVTLPCF